MRSYKLLLINLFILSVGLELRAQCDTDFKVQQVEYSETKQGTIELGTSNSQLGGSYTIKVYQINANVDLIVERRLSPINNTLEINGLSANTYWVRIEWDDNCFKTIGGLDGIMVGPNQEKR